MIYKLAQTAEKSWNRLRGHNQLPKVILGVKFNDGVSQLRSFTMYQAAERFLNGRLALPDVARGSDAIWTGDEIAGLTGYAVC
jgi:hypothetical protein